MIERTHKAAAQDDRSPRKKVESSVWMDRVIESREPSLMAAAFAAIPQMHAPHACSQYMHG